MAAPFAKAQDAAASPSPSSSPAASPSATPKKKKTKAISHARAEPCGCLNAGKSTKKCNPTPAASAAPEEKEGQGQPQPERKPGCFRQPEKELH